MIEEEVSTNDLASSLRRDALTPIAPGSFEFNRPAEIPREKPSLFGALLRTENPFGSAFEYLKTQNEISKIPALEGYNWRDGVPEDLKEFEWQYINADSPLKANEITYGIRQRQADKAKISDSPLQAFGMSIVMAPLDITNYFPGGILYKEFSLGTNVFKTAKSVAFANMAATVPLEAALMATQADREFKEAAISTLGAGVVGGLLGAGIGYIGSKAAKAAKYDVVDTVMNGIGEPKERPLNKFTTKSEAVTQMETHNAKQAERQNITEAIGSAKESDVTFRETHSTASAEAKKSGKSIYSDMSVEDIIHAIKTSDFAINVHNMVAAFAKKVPIPPSVIKRSYLYAKLSKNELIKLAEESDTSLLKSMSHEEKTFSSMTQDQASMITSANNSAAYARMTTEQAIQTASKMSDLSRFGDIKTKPISEGAPKGNEQNISAAQSSYVSEEKSLADLLSQETLAGGGRFPLKLTSFISPRNAMMNSSNPYVRQLADLFFESNWIKNKFKPEGANIARDVSVETNMKVLFGRVARAVKDYQDIFYEQAGVAGKFGLFRPERAAASREGLSVSEFGNQVSFALRNGDIHENSYVQKAAQLLRKEGFDPLKEIAIAQGRLPDNVSVETANSYLTRLFNNQFIKENQERFYSDIFPWFKQKNEELKAMQPMIQAKQAEIKSAEAKLKRTKKPSERKALKEEIENLKNDLNNSVPKDLKDSDGNIRKVIEDPEQMQSVIEQTIENVLGRNMEKLSNPLSKSGASGKATPLHNRAWLIDDNTVAPYLVNDPLEVLETYAKEMIPELQLTELAKKIFEPSRINAKLATLTKQLEVAKSKNSDPLTIGRIQDRIDVENQKIAEINSRLKENKGEPTIEMAVSQMMREATEHRNTQIKGSSPEEAAKIEKSFSVDEKNILDSIDILKGIYKNGSNTLNGTAGTVLRNIKKWNYLRYMGYMVISSLPDLAMHTLRHGPGAFIQEGLMPAFKQISGLKNLQFNKELLYDLGRCMETAMGQRLKAFVDGEGIVVQPGKITKAFDYLSNRYGNASLFNQWQDQMQFIAGNMSISRTLRSIDGWAKTGKMSPSDHLRLNALGLDESHWPVIHKEWKRTGGIEEGSYWSDYGSWDVSDPGIADTYNVFKAGIINEIDSTNVRVNMGDKPRIAYDSAFSLILQFRAFMLASTNTVLTSGLSRNDQNFYMGMISLLGMGGLAYVISSKLKRPDEEVDLSPRVLLLNAVDRSGALGVFMEGWNIGRKLIPIDGGVSRYQSRSKLGNLFGPTAQAIDDISYVLNAAQNSISEDGEPLSTKDVQKTAALIPLRQMWWCDNATKQLLNKLAIGLGAEES